MDERRCQIRGCALEKVTNGTKKIIFIARSTTPSRRPSQEQQHTIEGATYNFLAQWACAIKPVAHQPLVVLV